MLHGSSPLAVVAAALVVAGCSYDWSTGPDAVDAQDATASDASPVDASTTDVGTVDAMLDTQAADSALDCNALLANVAAARASAKTCTLPVNSGTCTQTTTDECGCTQVINQSKTNYESAVAAYHAAMCTNSPCPSCGTAQTGLCLASDASTTAFACSQ